MNLAIITNPEEEDNETDRNNVSDHIDVVEKLEDAKPEKSNDGIYSD